MVRRDALVDALQRVRHAETAIERQMESAGLPGAQAVIHGLRHTGDEIAVTPYSSADVFAHGVRRVRHRDRITVVYGQAVTDAIAAAATFHRGRLQ